MKVGDIVVPSGKLKSSRGYNLNTFSKGVVTRIIPKHLKNRDLIQVKILDSFSNRHWSDCYTSHMARKGGTFMIYREALKKLYTEEDKLSYSIY